MGKFADQAVFFRASPLDKRDSQALVGKSELPETFLHGPKTSLFRAGRGESGPGLPDQATLSLPAIVNTHTNGTAATQATATLLKKHDLF